MGVIERAMEIANDPVWHRGMEIAAGVAWLVRDMSLDGTDCVDESDDGVVVDMDTMPDIVRPEAFFFLRREQARRIPGLRETADDGWREIRVGFVIATDTVVVDHVVGGLEFPLRSERLFEESVGNMDIDGAIFHVAGRLGVPERIVGRARGMRDGLVAVAEAVHAQAASDADIPFPPGNPRLPNDDLARNDVVLDGVGPVNWSWAKRIATFTVGTARCFRIDGGYMWGCHFLEDDRNLVEEMAHDWREAGGGIPESGPLPEKFLAYARERLSRFPNLVEVGMGASSVDVRLYRPGDRHYYGLMGIMTGNPLEAAMMMDVAVPSGPKGPGM